MISSDPPRDLQAATMTVAAEAVTLPSPRVLATQRRPFPVRFMLLACIVIGVVGYLSSQWSRRNDIMALHVGSARRLAVLSTALFSPIDKFSYLPELVAQYPQMTALLENPGDAFLAGKTNELLKRINDSSRSAVVYLLDRQGRAIAASNWQEPESFVGREYAFRPYFRDAMQSGTGRFYGMGVSTLMPGYFLSSAVVKGGVRIGVVVVKIDMRTFDSNWRNKDEVMVSDPNGIIFLSSKSEWKYRPLHALPAGVMSQLARTRQFENVLQPTLESTVVEDIGPGEQLRRISRDGTAAGVKDGALYFVKSENLAGSDWTLHVLTSIDEIDAHARSVAVLSAAALSFIALVCLYLEQRRRNVRDRENSRRALEEAHGTLEQQHRRLQAISEELRVTSTMDPLTGAFNRRHFFGSVQQLLGAQRRTDGMLSIVMLDIDHFKQINDTHGHPVGDCVLQGMTALAHGVLRDGDLFARFGGEEFIIALPNASLAEAVAAAERLREQVAACPMSCDGVSVDVHVSCGVAQHRNDQENIEDTIRRADAALYQAKRAGRNRVEAA